MSRPCSNRRAGWSRTKNSGAIRSRVSRSLSRRASSGSTSCRSRWRKRSRSGGHFCIRPLLPIVDSTGWFWLLTITAGRTRLLRGSRWTIGEVGGIDLPQGVEELYNETVFQEQHYARPDARPQRSGVGGLSHAQSFGAAPEDLRKGLLLQYLRRIAGIVEPVIKREPAPLILAAQPEIQGNFREMASWKELCRRASRTTRTRCRTTSCAKRPGPCSIRPATRSRGDAIGRLNGLIGTGNGKATTTPEDIVKAARYGRVERLFLLPGRPVWGRLIEAGDEAEDRIVAHDETGARTTTICSITRP